MPTQTAELRANKSADRRRDEAHARLAKARRSDVQHRVPYDKHQWNALIQWLLSESKRLDDDDRRLMFQHLWECAEQMNEGSRKVRADLIGQ